MIEAVFISDLHLHPEEKAIQARFDNFIIWAKNSVKKIYILGDFFHIWVGDDSINKWSMAIAKQLYSLSVAGISVFYMHGNRDFLLGEVFASHAGWTILTEPYIISLGEEKVMLVHGDSYCTKDKAHQRLRRLTRNKLFPGLFLFFPLSFRERIANKVRSLSQGKQRKIREEMDVVPETVIEHMTAHKIATLIHGHTHQPGLITYSINAQELRRFVLSDWDDKVQILCYDKSKGVYFIQFKFWG